MTSKLQHVVFAHMSGFGDLHCHSNGQYVFSCGSDNAIRIFDTEAKLLTSLEGHHTAAIRSLSFSPKGDSFVTAGDDHCIQTFTILNTDKALSKTTATTPLIPKVKFEQTLHRATGTVHCVSYHAGGNLIAVAGDEKNIKLLNLLDNTQVTQLHGHPTSIRYLSFSPQGDLLASIDSLGTLHINLWADKKNLFLENICPAIHLSKTNQMAKCSWSHDSELLALPGRPDIRILTTHSTFKDAHLTLKGGHAEPVSICAFSPNSLYLASYAGDRKIVIWEMKTGEVLTATILDDDVDAIAHCLSISWCRQENALFILDDQGYIKKWDNIIPAHLPSAYKTKEAKARYKHQDAIDTTQLDPIGDSLDDEDDEEQQEQQQAQSSPSSSRRSNTADADDEEDDADGQHRKRLRKAAELGKDTSSSSSSSSAAVLNDGLPDDFDDDEDMEDFIVDDTNGAYKDNDDDYLSRKQRESLTHNPHTQAAFQPSSTPFDPVTKRRYLCWNLIGNIVTQSNDIFHSIEISFSDTSKHKAIRLRDHYGFTMASLGEHGCVFASPYENAQRPAVLFFRAFDSWSAKSDWTLHLPAPENAVAVAIGTKFAAIATDKQWVRVTSFTGIQLTVLCMKGPIVCMIGHQHLLAIVYHSGMPLPQHQNESVLILDVEHKKRVFEIDVALSPGATLTWLHFSDYGLLLSMDSAGVVRALAKQWDHQWVAVLDTSNIKKASKSDVYWPVGLLSDQLMCAVCRGGIKVPSTITKPILTPITLQLPFVPTEYSQAEEIHAHSDLLLFEQYAYNHALSIASSSLSSTTPFHYNPTPKEQAQLDALLLPSIQLACKSDQSSKALDLCHSLMLIKSLELMMKLANHERKVNLAGRIGLLMGAKEREKEREKERLLSGREIESKMSIDAFMEQGDKRVSDEKRKRMERIQREEAELLQEHRAARNKPNKRVAADRAVTAAGADAEEERDEVDEGESELVYSKSGKKRVKIVEKSPTPTQQQDGSSSTSNTQDSSSASVPSSSVVPPPVIVEVDDPADSSNAESGKTVDFLTLFKRQKDAEKAEKAEKEKEKAAAEKENKTKKEKTKKATGAAATIASTANKAKENDQPPMPTSTPASVAFTPLSTMPSSLTSTNTVANAETSKPRPLNPFAKNLA